MVAHSGHTKVTPLRPRSSGTGYVELELSTDERHKPGLHISVERKCLLLNALPGSAFTALSSIGNVPRYSVRMVVPMQQLQTPG
jgi:hypothetical protein